MYGLVLNTRRPIFSDMRVREAILQLFDFEWINHNYFFDLYTRTASYFDGCELSAHGVAADSRERALLAPFPGSVRGDIMDGKWSPPVTDGSGRDRESLRQAFALFAAAGYDIKGTVLTQSHERTAVQFRNIDHDARPGAACARVQPQSQARGHRRARAQCRRDAIRTPQNQFRFRHDGIPMGAVALARQRTKLLLGIGRGGRSKAAAITWASNPRRSTR